MKANWGWTFPRLYEIFCEGGQNNIFNYFQNFEEELENPLALAKNKLLEEDLQQLDGNAWQELKQKTIQYVTIRDKNRAWEQLFDHLLSEAKGYLYLKSEGCTEVRFIPVASTKTPDLYGRCGNSGILVEVKTINVSDKEREYLRNNSELPKAGGCMRVREGPDAPSELLKSKITDTIATAKEKFVSYRCEGVQRKVVYLVIYPDRKFVLSSRSKDELVSFVTRQDKEEQDSNQVEVKYCFGDC